MTQPQGPAFSCALSGLADAFDAAAEACDQIDLNGARADLVFVFISPHHVGVLGGIGRIVAERLGAGCVIGVSAESVVGGAVELEHTPGVALLGASLPGVRLEPFWLDELPLDGEVIAEALGAAMGVEADTRALMVVADPFTVPISNLLPVLNDAVGASRDGAHIIGGMASAGSTPGCNALVLNDRARRTGAVGVTISGPVRIDTIVSQGAKPIGPNLVITKARRNLIVELGGQPAVEAIKGVIAKLDPRGRQELAAGLLIGIVIDEYKERFGRGDYLVRGLTGADPDSGVIGVGDLVRVGQTVRLHVRDAATASEDLALLLDAQSLHTTPAGALLFTCNGRGTRLFGRPGHDAETIARAFAPPPPGPSRAKPGFPIGEHAASIPLAGFFAAGEIGPVGGTSFLHGHTASVALFRGAPAGA